MGRGVARIRNDDPDRLRRILNDKQRIMGVDIEALDKQVAEKEEAKLSALCKDKESSNEAKALSYRAMAMEEEAVRRRRQLAMDCAIYWGEKQTKDSRLERDLNRKDYLRNSQPARIGDDDPRCGPSSMQKFDGEDLQISERKKVAVCENCKNWTEQRREMEKRQQHEAEEVACLEQLIKQQDEVRKRTAEEAQNRRIELNKADRDLNRKLSEERKQEMEARKAAEKVMDRAELEKMKESPFLNEIVARKDSWKGMTKFQTSQIEEQRRSQIEFRRNFELNNKLLEQEEDLRESDVIKQRDRAALDALVARKVVSESAAASLKLQMTEKKIRDESMRKTYQNEISDDFFGQFQSSHR